MLWEGRYFSPAPEPAGDRGLLGRETKPGNRRIPSDLAQILSVPGGSFGPDRWGMGGRQEFGLPHPRLAYVGRKRVEPGGQQQQVAEAEA